MGPVIMLYYGFRQKKFIIIIVMITIIARMFNMRKVLDITIVVSVLGQQHYSTSNRTMCYLTFQMTTISFNRETEMQEFFTRYRSLMLPF